MLKQIPYSFSHSVSVGCGSKRFIRYDSPGDDYSEAAIMERISGKGIIEPEVKAAAPTKPNMLIDIQAKMQQANSPGFEQWAKIYKAIPHKNKRSKKRADVIK